MMAIAPYGYAYEKLLGAMEIMATGKGSRPERLARAGKQYLLPIRSPKMHKLPNDLAALLDAFYHAFFDTVVHKDDTFSTVRAERMDWIEATLTDPQTQRLQGYLAKTKTHDPARRVELRHQNFIVVLIMGMKQDGSLKAEFLTCYAVNNNRLPKVQQAPAWNRQDCENVLRKG